MALTPPSDPAGMPVDDFFLRLTWREPTEDLLAHQSCRLSKKRELSPLLATRLFPKKLKSEGYLPSPSTSQLPTSSLLPQSPTTSDSEASTATSSSGASVTEVDSPLFRKANGRHIPLFYTLEGTPKCDELVTKIMRKLSPQCEDIIANLAPDRMRKNLSRSLTDFGNAYCKLLKQYEQANEETPYGTMVSSGTRPIQNPSVDYECDKDMETNKPDIIVLDGDVKPEKGQRYDWSMLVSFIEVKKHSAKDCTEGSKGPLLQSIRYTRKILQYTPMRSHLHFVTWCGHLVRLWYIDAAHFGCSLAYSIKKEEDRLEIGRIFYLLMSSKCRDILSARWNPARHPPLHVVANQLRLPSQTAPLFPRFVRPGPFGSRTMLWSTKTADTSNKESKEEVFLKLSWVVERLSYHELEMQTHLADLWHTPTPLGHALIPPSAAGFRARTSQNGDNTQSCLHLSALLYKHRLGRSVKPEDAESCLAELHAQFAEQLLDYTQRGLHYRDLNTGNFMVEVGTSDKLVLVDHGNMRWQLRPRGNEPRYRVTDFVQRARDDARSANPLFLPSSISSVQDEDEEWNFHLYELSEDFEFDANGRASLADIEKATALLRSLRSNLVEIVANSHRYIDDLESAVYLHLWQRGHKGEIRKNLTSCLEDLNEKHKRWERDVHWERTLRPYHPTASFTWNQAMLEVRKIILNARKKVRADIVAMLDFKVPADQMVEDLRNVIAANPGRHPKEAVLELLEKVTPHLTETEDAMETEIECFEDCIKFWKEAARKLKQEEQKPKGNVGQGEAK